MVKEAFIAEFGAHQELQEPIEVSICLKLFPEDNPVEVAANYDAWYLKSWIHRQAKIFVFVQSCACHGNNQAVSSSVRT